jgi:Nucleotidyl transferase AbiEii toxin, Type IV TA system
MAEYTRPATWDDLLALARALDHSGARYALIGGYAIAAHGYNRFSEDVDLLVDPSPDNTARWVEALSSLPDGAAKELAGDPDIFEREGHYAIRINDEITVDVMPAACGHGWLELRQFAIRIDLGEGVSMSVLSLEGLLLTKEGLRDKDKADRAVLLRALGRSDSR